ncbi:hypothetical protein B4135_0845 [Caldibacillus debilis]|uniref:Uncharacterized protein n=1 Tax=Caldibacillus debilis TaxID=301148 RepID=A0A150M6D2_9BACI|nr:hypothetical protein B4135_0845 [Caldibacillus debilis]
MPGNPGSPAPAAGQKREPSRSGPAGEEGRFFAFRPSLLPATAVSLSKGRPLIRHSL